MSANQFCTFIHSVTGMARAESRPRPADRRKGALAWLCAVALAFGAPATGRAAAEAQIVAVAAAGNYSLAVDSNGGVRAWGGNAGGQLGDGTRTNRNLPVQVQDPSERKGFLTKVLAVSANGQSLALKTDGTVRAWGGNGVGQLGDGTQTDRLTPVQVKDPSDSTGFLRRVKAVAAGSGFSLALKDDGTVWAWGSNTEGQLGDGTTSVIPRLTPGKVKDPSDPTGFLINVTAIAAGLNNTSAALKTDGTVWAWGRSNVGQVGNPAATIPQKTPIQVKDLNSQLLTGVTAISAGLSHFLALKADQTVWAWGFNQNGQIGDGTVMNRSTAVPVPGLANV
jgi:alpha-tubulin suppressor-like RCC1 family protein